VTVYTMGVWRVKPGREDDFVNAWDELARWTVEAGFESTGTLLRHRTQPGRFVSFSPWPSLEAAEEWRASPGFAERLRALSDTLEAFEPETYDVVLRVS
jgi:heme-degrading monooxygenase HmoA